MNLYTVPVKIAHHLVQAQDCLKGLILASIRDEGLMPPKCDGREIPDHLFIPLLSSAELTLFNAKRFEYSTLNRLYCSKVQCSTFLGNASDYKFGRSCPKCYSVTCTKCKAPWHGSDSPCATDGDVDVIAALCSAGLQQCKRCKRVVELRHGCNHIVSFGETVVIWLRLRGLTPLVLDVRVSSRVLLRVRSQLEIVHLPAMGRRPID